MPSNEPEPEIRQYVYILGRVFRQALEHDCVRYVSCGYCVSLKPEDSIQLLLTTMIRSFSIALFTLLFLGVMFGGLFHMSIGMDMAGSMTDCPFVSSGEELCKMSLSEHVGAWKSTFMTTIPTLTLLISALAAAAVIVSVAPNVFAKPKFKTPALPKEILEHIYTFSYRPLQDLFSNGILHPKLF